jgi:hypothetical protein
LSGPRRKRNVELEGTLAGFLALAPRKQPGDQATGGAQADSPARTSESVLLCLALFALSALICWPLFQIEYLDDLLSNEGTFITFGRFLLDHWPHCSWFPWFNAGMPFENTYLPLVPALTAILAFLGRCSPAQAFHFLAALTYSLAPAFWFLFARKVSGRLAPSFWAALLWSLFSPSLFIPAIREDTGPWLSIRRLNNMVYWGETPHNVALCLLPLALLLLARYLERQTARRFAVSVLAVAAVMLSNAFGAVVIGICSLMLFAVRQERRWRELVSTCAILAAAYLLICRLVPPSLVRLIRTNTQPVAGDHSVILSPSLLAALFILMLALVWFATRRLPNPMLRFAVLFSACFGGITVLWYSANLGFLPQPQRYHLEMEIGLCLLAAFALAPLLGRMPRKNVVVAAALCAIPLGWIAVQDCLFARRLIHPIDATQAMPFREARWLARHLPGQRIMVSGEAGFWFNLVADNPQLSAGHEPSAPNWMQRVAVYAIYSGENAGDQDGPISIFWLKVFGCGAITVPGPGSKDHYHPIRHPRKFDGLLPLIWREGDDSIYQVPLRSASLAHVIPAAAAVTRRPLHGLDIEPARRYVAALEDPQFPAADLAWENPGRGRISTRIDPGQVVSVQITYDPGWRARTRGQNLRVYPDQLGMIVIEPHCSGECAIDLEFAGGLERTICVVVSSMTAILLLGMLLWPARFRPAT